MAKSKKQEPTRDEPTFEESLARLQAIVQELEGGDVPLERSLELFEEGVALGRRCSARLDEAEKRVSLLVERADGALEERDWDEAPGREETKDDSSPKKAARRGRPGGGSAPAPQGDIPF